MIKQSCLNGNIVNPTSYSTNRGPLENTSTVPLSLTVYSVHLRPFSRHFSQIMSPPPRLGTGMHRSDLRLGLIIPDYTVYTRYHDIQKYEGELKEQKGGRGGKEE